MPKFNEYLKQKKIKQDGIKQQKLKNSDEFINRYKKSHEMGPIGNEGWNSEKAYKRFSEEEIVAVSKALMKNKIYGVSDSVKLTDSPLWYAGSRKRGRFERKDLKKAANIYIDKAKEHYVDETREELEDWRQNGFNHTGEEKVADFTEEFKEEMRSIEVVQDMYNKSDNMKLCYGYPTDTEDFKPMQLGNAQNDVNIEQRLNMEFDNLMFSEEIADDILHMKPVFRNSAKMHIDPSYSVGGEDEAAIMLKLNEISASPEQYGVAESDNYEENGGFNTMMLKELMEVGNTVRYMKWRHRAWTFVGEDFLRRKATDPFISEEDREYYTKMHRRQSEHMDKMEQRIHKIYNRAWLPACESFVKHEKLVIPEGSKMKKSSHPAAKVKRFSEYFAPVKKDN